MSRSASVKRPGLEPVVDPTHGRVWCIHNGTPDGDGVCFGGRRGRVGMVHRECLTDHRSPRRRLPTVADEVRRTAAASGTQEEGRS